MHCQWVYTCYQTRTCMRHLPRSICASETSLLTARLMGTADRECFLPPCRTLTTIGYLCMCRHHTAQVHLCRIFTPAEARCMQSIDLGYGSQRYRKQYILGLLATSPALEKSLAFPYSGVPYLKHMCCSYFILLLCKAGSLPKSIQGNAAGSG